MASDAAVSQFASFFDAIHRDRDLPPIIPFIMGTRLAVNNPTGSDQPARVSRLVINVGDDQNMVVIQSGSAGIDALMRQLAREGHPPASKASIAAMPTVEIKEGGGECPICLEELAIGGEGKQMPCGHVFDADCVDKWLNAHGTCPVCRFTMPAEEEEPEINDDSEEGVSFNIFLADTIDVSQPTNDDRSEDIDDSN